MLLLLLPLSQQIFSYVQLKPLNGAVEKPELPELHAGNWWDGRFQQGVSAAYEYEVGFRPFLIRLRNQLYYWLYDQSTTYVVPGSSGQFYSWDYWAAYRGLDYVGRDSIDSVVRQLAVLRKRLQENEKELLVVVAPNKVRYLPEHLPARLNPQAGEQTNYQAYRRALDSAKIPWLDFNRYLIRAKDTVLKPLFANTSIHWSGYGMQLAISKIIDTLEVLGQQDHINLRYAKWVMKDSAISSDRDMVDLMNLLDPPSTEPLAFPVYELDTADNARPVKMILIGDSFFWNFYAFDVRHKIFSADSRFWYYNKTQMDLNGKRTPVDSVSIRTAVAEADYVIIMATESNLDRFPYGFPGDYLKALNTGQ